MWGTGSISNFLLLGRHRMNRCRIVWDLWTRLGHNLAMLRWLLILVYDRLEGLRLLGVLSTLLEDLLLRMLVLSGLILLLSNLAIPLACRSSTTFAYILCDGVFLEAAGLRWLRLLTTAWKVIFFCTEIRLLAQVIITIDPAWSLVVPTTPVIVSFDRVDFGCSLLTCLLILFAIQEATCATFTSWATAHLIGICCLSLLLSIHLHLFLLLFFFELFLFFLLLEYKQTLANFHWQIKVPLVIDDGLKDHGPYIFHLR